MEQQAPLWAQAGRFAGAQVDKLLGPPLSRSAWLLATFACLAAGGLLVLPMATYLWTSPKPLQELFAAFTVVVLILCGLGILVAYAQRLWDQGLHRVWAIALLIALPWALLSGIEAWFSHRAMLDPMASSGGYYGFGLAAWALVAGFFALRRGRIADPKVGRITARDLLRIKSPPILLLTTVSSSIVLVSLYAGFFQSGLWVGREQFSYFSGPVIRSPGGGQVIASCGNAKGVSAIAQEDVQEGFVRDGLNGTWSLVVSPDGSLDIQTFSDRQVLSYREDGFTVRPIGLRLGKYGALAADVDHFQIIAESSDGPDSNVTVISFAKREIGFSAVISAARAAGKGGILTPAASRASTYLFLADCTVDQERGEDR